MWFAPMASSMWSIALSSKRVTFKFHTQALLQPPKQFYCPLSSPSLWRDSSTKYVRIFKSNLCWVRSGIVSNSSITNFAIPPIPAPLSLYLFKSPMDTEHKRTKRKKSKSLNGTHIDCMQKKVDSIFRRKFYKRQKNKIPWINQHWRIFANFLSPQPHSVTTTN